MKKALLLAIVLCVFIGCGEKKGTFIRKANPDFKGHTAQFVRYGFSIKLYPEYKNVAGDDHAFCFVPNNEASKGTRKNLAVLFWPRDAGLYKKYLDAVSNPENFQDVDMLIKLEELGVTDKLVKVYKMNKPDFELACVIWTKEHKFLKKQFHRLRLELFPKNKKYQITVVMNGYEGDLNKLFNMAESIGSFPVKEKSIKRDKDKELLYPQTLEPLNPFSKPLKPLE
ncbi:hypothetical protein AUJ95_06145 [Candidatus Desantisbacteria bacterium CG2_30_40_21]|uniref:Uncharacterized protein n=5 Tax=unclassified Candidatus Desantisiibacteriota TaxID=3106372 RepID=A0A2M7JCD1_9BACT|nr:MAG: hypothetical protein AUJ95_06145 [Candidatus Desantisbacteria bacterium CG2_30_40_21]PIP41110.1 MAG: hypothetical protein COX18_04470 [Candidatus Desantisbacteria bacterium CG23_combo_of_CG06-09_8_20_14_all_40_23]PIX17044.1 MAG: hypothetical protein COZ71_05370 [Candidatus Desantisbacteria bacterium CG_4_8_14_3_um_filter_40_12]PIY18523.1 MAG: hypothetical protein COZ13_10150 [Candidatus Desantisbacteria bacterium CG_4_10_14_3_um_filter_40_18]PJB30242.1 MAG: hypothetical protein CO110_01